jgi:hypothetical protein
LICTAYAPKLLGEQPVDNSIHPVKPMVLPNQTMKLFTGFLAAENGGEQVAKKFK